MTLSAVLIEWMDRVLIGYSFSLSYNPIFAISLSCLDDVHLCWHFSERFHIGYSQSIEQGIHNWRDVTQVNNVLRLRLLNNIIPITILGFVTPPPPSFANNICSALFILYSLNCPYSVHQHHGVLRRCL